MMNQYDGMASTTFVLNGSVVTSSTLSAVSFNTGTGETILEPTTTHTGRIQLKTGATAGVAAIEFPITFGNYSGSIMGVDFEIDGLYFIGTRPTLTAALVQQSTSPPRQYGLLWDEFGAKLLSNKGTSGTETATMMQSNITKVVNGHASFGWNVPALTLTGDAAGSTARLPILAGGQYKLRISNETRVTEGYSYFNHSALFREARLTIHWGVPGGAVEKVL